MSVNKVILVGRLGQDPELRYTQSGTPVCNFSMATSEQWTDKQGQKQERTEWHRIVVWGKLGELCNQYLAKGREAYVEGKLATRKWQDQNGQDRYSTEVESNSVQFLGGAPSNQQNQQQRPQGNAQAPQGNRAPQGNQAPPQQAQGYQNQSNFAADDIPF